MTIICKICQRVFEKQITNSHLRGHGITTAIYKQDHGAESLTSAAYKAQLSLARSGENNANYGNSWTADQKNTLSEKLKNKSPWNKGKKIESTQTMKDGIARRELKYQSGEISRISHKWTDEQKQNLSTKTKLFFEGREQEAKDRARKAVETKRANGFDFGSSARGKKHSQETKDKISAQSKKNNTVKSELALSARLKRIADSDLTVLSSEGVTLTLSCNKCGNNFMLTRQCFTESKFKTTWCTICNPVEAQYRSKAEIEIYEFVKSLAPDTVNNQRLLPNRQEIDIYVPSKKLAIEFNGLYWHSEKMLSAAGKSKHSDYEKMLAAKKIGLRYIGIFEDEWLSHPDIVKSRLSYILNNSQKTIFARKCVIQEIGSKEASDFCQQNHIQRRGRSNIRYGLYYENELVSLMSFSKSNISRKIQTWEINRFCNKLNINIVGGASRLFNKFIKDHSPQEVISYADSRWSEGKLYQVLGFAFVRQTVPNYWYVLPNTNKRIHRFSLRKTIHDAKNKTEVEIRKSQGYSRIWDCGSTKWIWKKGQ